MSVTKRAEAGLLLEAHVDSGANEDTEITAINEGGQNFLTVTVAGSGSSSWFDVLDCDSVIVVATGAAKFYTATEDRTITRELYVAGAVQNCTATKCGIVSGSVMPQFLRITDTSTSSNPMTIYFNRKNRAAIRRDGDVLG